MKDGVVLTAAVLSLIRPEVQKIDSEIAEHASCINALKQRRDELAPYLPEPPQRFKEVVPKQWDLSKPLPNVVDVEDARARRRAHNEAMLLEEEQDRYFRPIFNREFADVFLGKVDKRSRRYRALVKREKALA